MKTDVHWSKIGQVPHHGICTPLFSLRTKNSFGIGEFLDLIPLIDWCKKNKFDCIQLLPINDSGADPSPYNPLSSSALDPVYLSLSELGIQTPLISELPLRNQILSLKLDLLQKHFPKPSIPQIFLQQHPWVEPYSRFKALKEQFSGKHWKEWPLNAKPEQEKVNFYTFLQFHAFRQMEMVRNYASQQGVFLKGDIPILLSPDSADVWTHPSLFRLDLGAGAPPDAYNRLGQSWGFPLFDWDAMRANGFQWWKQRLKTAEKLYHIYRIDHVVGFFRIWGIERGKKASEGSFFPADPNLWMRQGKEILEMMIDATTMLPMAEDLGTIPKEVYPILKELGICGTKVVRWQKNHGQYIPFHEYEPFSLTTLSTPDMDPLELWWKKYPSESAPFAEFMHWAYHPILTAKQRLKILQEVNHSSSFFHINLLQEYLALFPELVGKDLEKERINIPGTVLPTNWTYRYRPTLEEIANHKGLEEAISLILEDV